MSHDDTTIAASPIKQAAAAFKAAEKIFLFMILTPHIFNAATLQQDKYMSCPGGKV
jgi:hypothetical protein